MDRVTVLATYNDRYAWQRTTTYLLHVLHMICVQLYGNALLMLAYRSDSTHATTCVPDIDRLQCKLTYMKQNFYTTISTTATTVHFRCVRSVNMELKLPRSVVTLLMWHIHEHT
jgi:hypothetical protein